MLCPMISSYDDVYGVLNTYINASSVMLGLLNLISKDINCRDTAQTAYYKIEINNIITILTPERSFLIANFR